MSECSIPTSKSIQEEIDSDRNFQSWSSTQIKVVKARHIWTINNFSFCVEKNGEKLVSPTFSAGIGKEKTEWCLELYPKGENKKSINSVSLYLKLVSCNLAEIQTTYRLGIMNSKGQDDWNGDLNVERFKKQESRGYETFVLQDVLFNRECDVLLEDKLTIICEIVSTVGSGNISGTLTTPKSDLVKHLAFLLEDKQWCDVTLFGGGKEFKAHKVILVARSPVFKAMFQHDMEESRSNRVEITDIDEEGLCEMLRYMYTGKIYKLKTMAPTLLGIAEKYAMEDLKSTCENALFESLSLENAAEFYILSDTFCLLALRNHVKSFMVAHASEVVNTPEFETLIRTHPHLCKEIFLAISKFCSDQPGITT